MSAAPETLLALRRAFDAAFASEPAAPTERVDLVALRAGGRSCAVRVSELAGVVPFAAATPLPCEEPALLGIAAVRGMVLPVYDLGALLGGGEGGAPRWMLLCAGPRRVALAFDEMEGYLRVAREDVVPASPPGPAAGAAVSELVRAGSSTRPVVSVAALSTQLEQRFAAPMEGR